MESKIEMSSIIIEASFKDVWYLIIPRKNILDIYHLWFLLGVIIFGLVRFLSKKSNQTDFF